MSAQVDFSLTDEIATITLNAPATRNAITLAMREALVRRLRECLWEDGCRAVVLTGGGGHFSTGGDMKAVDLRDKPDVALTRRNLAVLHEVVRLIATGPKPVVAAVAGDAFGAGMALAMCCDYVVAADAARFCASFARVGLVADCGLAWSLPRRIGLSAAKRLMMSARVVGAAEAERLGMVDGIVPADQLLAEAKARARELSGNAPLSVALIKSLLARDPLSLESVLGCELELQPVLTLTDDYGEGRAAFREKRPPRFKGG